MATDQHMFILYHKGVQASWAKAKRIDGNRWIVVTKHGNTPHATSERLAKITARDFVMALRATLIREGKALAKDLTIVST